MQYIELMNSLGKAKQPFLFIIDFESEEPVVVPLSELDGNSVLFSLTGNANFTPQDFEKQDVCLQKHPIEYNEYLKSFEVVHQNLKFGNSYLTNLTFPTKVELNLGLRELFHSVEAKYKLFYQGKFVVFSPETFVEIYDGKIASHPMKGTIDADLPNAEEVILNDEKEMAEHTTIVDLIRNDLSIVAKNVRVEKYRYITRINTRSKNLLQVSSKIVGDLPKEYAENIGSIISSLLPAGSISGAPKRKTVEIIKESETYKRGYYTGVFGLFDGQNLDSGVMIRFIEKIGDEYFFKSGGGITYMSDPKSEYQELIDKVYVPIA